MTDELLTVTLPRDEAANLLDVCPTDVVVAQGRWGKRAVTATREFWEGYLDGLEGAMDGRGLAARRRHWFKGRVG